MFSIVSNFLYSKKLLLLSLLLLSLSFTFPKECGFFSLFAFVPFFYFLSSNKEEKKFLYDVFFFSIFLGLFSTLWFFSIFPITAIGRNGGSFFQYISFPVVWSLFLLALSVPYLLFTFLSQPLFSIRKKGFLLLLLPSLWVVAEYLKVLMVAIVLYGEKSLFGAHHAYYSIAYTAAYIPYIKNLFPVGGMYLVSFVIFFVNVLIYFLFAFSEYRRYVPFLTFSLVIIFFLGTGSYNHISEKYTSFSILSTKLPSSVDTKTDIQKAETVLSYLSKNQDSLGQVVVVPENVNLARLLTGSVSNDFTFLANTTVLGSFSTDSLHLFYYLDGGSKKVTYFEKRLLMPVTEYQVMWTRSIPFLSRNQEGKIKESSLPINRGDDAVMTLSNHLTLYGSLCSENISPILYREETLRGAEVLINAASHSFFRGSPLLARQTEAINISRALENGRYFVVASNYSNSYVISNTGNVVIKTSPKEGVTSMNYNIPSFTYITPYVRYGDYIVALSFTLLFLYFVWGDDVRKKKGGKE